MTAVRKRTQPIASPHHRPPPIHGWSCPSAECRVASAASCPRVASHAPAHKWPGPPLPMSDCRRPTTGGQAHPVTGGSARPLYT